MKSNNEEKKIFKAKQDISEATTNMMSSNFPKFSMTKLSSSLINSKINNSSNQKIFIQDNSNINNSNNITDSILLNDSTKEKKSITKSKLKNSIRESMNKRNKNKRKVTMLPNIQNDKNNKTQQTIFQKIITDLDKVKTKADKTLDVMRKNLKISRREIVKRRNYQKESQIIPTNILNFEKNEENRNLNIFNRSLKFNNSQQSFFISKIKNKNISNIYPNTSSNNFNQSISNGSTMINLNNLNDIDFNFKMNNTSSNMNIFNGFKTGIRSRSQLNINSKSIKNKANYGFKAKLNLLDIPRVSLASIKSEYQNKPLFPFEKNKNCYKNMYHSRSLEFPLKTIRAHCYKIYGIPAILVEQNAYNKDNEMNSLTIINKIQLIQDNIEYFKINYMYKNDFLEAFSNMENYQKAEFNYKFEEICCVIIKIVPVIFQNYYDILKKLLYIVIPNLDEEREKKPESENECLNLNYTFFNAVSDYFNICVEVYYVLNKKCDRFIYTINEFAPLNSYLDITRYNSTNLISMANCFINKTKNDLKILDKLEVALKMKKAEKEEVDIFERYHRRHRKKELDEDIKIERINRALNLKSRINRPEINEAKYFDKYKVNKKISAFYSPVFRDMMKYFKPNIKAKIIAQQVVDRYEQKKKKYGNISEGNEEK